MKPSPGADPGLRPYKGRVTAVCDGIVPSARLERALSAASGLCLCHWATRAWSLWAGLNGLLRFTRAALCQVSYRGMAAGQGLEPRFAASEAAVLPLDDPALVGEEGLEPSSGCFWGRPLFRWRTRPQCAASDSNREPPD